MEQEGNAYVDLAKKNEERRVSRLSGEERENELIEERDRLRAVAEGKGTKAIAAQLRLLEIEEELKKIVHQRIDAAVRENAEKQEERDAAAKERKEQADWLDDIIAKTEQDLIKAEEDRTKELERQRDALEGQRDAIKQTLAEYAKSQRRAIRATTDEVRSGDRRIGPRARQEVKALDKSQARLRKLEDAEQRLREQFDAAPTEGDRNRIQREGRKIRAEKEAELGRSEGLKRGLEGRVSDIDTNKASLEQLTKINTGIDSLNDKLTSTTL
jgi:hypothetical protein